MEEEKEWIVPVVYESCGFIKVMANTPEKACEKVKENPDNYPLPYNAEYIDGSFDISGSVEEAAALTEIYTKMYKEGELREI